MIYECGMHTRMLLQHIIIIVIVNLIISVNLYYPISDPTAITIYSNDSTISGNNIYCFGAIK